MRNEALDFAVGFVPMALTGLALALAGGRRELVYCGTLTPYPGCSGPSGFCISPCLQTAWVPYWDGLYVVAAGAVLGVLLVIVGTPFPRGRGAPERSPSTTTHLLGVDTMPPRSNKNQLGKDFVRGRDGPSGNPRLRTGRPAPCPSGDTD